jgi:hypothetical protein
MPHQAYITIRFSRGLIFTFEEFLHSYSAAQNSGADFSYVTGIEFPVGLYSYPRATIINDLLPSAEAIFNNYQDSTRNKINQVIKKDLCRHKVISSPSDQDLQKLKALFDPFAGSAGIESLQMPYIRALMLAGRLCICYVYDRDNTILTGHVYRVSALRPELLHSFRTRDKDKSPERINFISKANRYSHYLDMLHFKSQGFDEYDFGGVSIGTGSEDPKWKNIDNFKASFGGQLRVFHNSILYNTVKSRVYLRLRGNPFA